MCTVQYMSPYITYLPVSLSEPLSSAMDVEAPKVGMGISYKEIPYMEYVQGDYSACV